jgi:hypothetical protein
MTVRTAMISAGLLASFAGFAGVEVRAGADKVAFPDNYAQGRSSLIDRAQNKQLIQYYVTPQAIDAAKRGKPLPGGTDIAAVAFASRLDEQG